MKKVLQIMAFVMCAVLLVSLTACAAPSFMSASKTQRAVKEFGTPQAKMTLNFTTGKGEKKRYEITYDLLLDKTPVTVINFINLVNDGFYQDVMFQTYNSTYNYYIAGAYSYRKLGEDTSARVRENNSGVTMIGEFKTNNFREPKGGYEPFSVFSLAMYHVNTAENFNSANGTLIFSAGATNTLNHTNYAVFARMNSIEIYEEESETPVSKHLSSTYLQILTALTNTYSFNVTTASGDSEPITLLGQSSSIPRFVFSIEMLGDKDWSKLPKVN